ncbi:uncharacterized protein LOC110692358 [Chenopodium quinoa]|uniref:uncharacterized protein LOC110692358 n=1 Tax=Chenopodium quinoa TaxID=63459 RepID=UPI000B783E54|nr:uncharacterized protein LOC110692358 [Chenopodium quinoa]
MWDHIKKKMIPLQHVPESPLGYAELIGYSSSEGSDTNYEPDLEENEGGTREVNESDAGEYEYAIDGDEIANLEREADEFNDELLGYDSDTSDDELQIAKTRVKECNHKLHEIAQQLEKEAADGRLCAQNQSTNAPRSEETSRGNLSDYEDSDDDIHTPSDSGEEDAQWRVGLRFSNRGDFKKALAKYAILQGRNLSIICSNKYRQQRLGVRCTAGCPFYMYSSWDSRRATFVIKTVEDNHTCHRNMKKNKQLKSTWLAEQFIEVFKARPHWPAKEIVETVRRAYKVIVTKDFAYKIKLFTCFEGLQKGWREGCRKVICVDACFIKTFLGGQLLSAIGRDANDQMFPIAWAIVEGENNQSWEWFFNALQSTLDLGEGEGIAVISDEHCFGVF